MVFYVISQWGLSSSRPDCDQASNIPENNGESQGGMLGSEQ